MRIVLFGGAGQLGQTFLESGRLAALGELTATTRDGTPVANVATVAADLAEPASVTALLDAVQPDVVINAAAYTAVDRAEQEEALARRVNAASPGAMAQWTAAHGALLIHYSTDYVFDGESPTPYPVDAPTGPLSAYGRSKLAGEQAVLAAGGHALIFRTAWVYAAHGKNFLRTMLRLAGERDELRVVADQVGTPTSTGLIADATLAALERWLAAPAAERPALEGVHHLVAGGSTSWHGFASAIVERAHALGLIARAPRVTAIGTSEFPTPARRPSYSLLDNREFQATFRTTLPPWQHGLEDVLQSLISPGS
ncbi:dTDP-4-dehydrorhamnose reductase [Dyella sp. SG562]|uniref:dTDP-4-dehydrorhamnose reductase n=1 Tax=Dyella sp. SG562 TaxID=2587017 RepID=UPI0014216ECE|nr:dTDP-4-dehydrorhamnose reductase [Dyella sp. SG562]NII74726.1 dTDP-4-dehydrorhamnose reductase [Dyella sp. SG562]